MYVCIYVCMYLCIYMYVCMYIYKEILWIMDYKQKRKENMTLIIPHFFWLIVESCMQKRIEISKRWWKTMNVGGDKWIYRIFLSFPCDHCISLSFCALVISVPLLYDFIEGEKRYPIKCSFFPSKHVSLVHI